MAANHRTPITPLAEEARSVITTREAAAHLCLSEQTLRCWACFEGGLIRPIRIGRRLGWPVADIKRVLGV